MSEVIRRDAESTAPVMMISAAAGFIEQSEKYSSDNAGQSLVKYTILHRGELAYNHGASKYRKYGSCFSLTIEAARVPFVYHCFEVGANNPDFVAMVLNVPQIDIQLRRLVSSGARMDGLLNISFDAYKTVEINLPRHAEQDKIATFFDHLDRLITLHQRKNFCWIFRSIIFPCKKTNAWEQRKVNEIADIVGGGTPSTHNPSYWDGDINWYAPAEMEGKRYAVNSERKITQAGLSNSSAKILPAGRTILFTSRAGIGKVAILQHDAATNQGFQSLVLKDGISPYFIYSMGSILKKKAEGIASGSTFLEIS